MGDTEGAIKIYNAFIDRYPDDERAYTAMLQIAYQYFSSGRWDALLRALQAYINLGDFEEAGKGVSSSFCYRDILKTGI